MDSAFLSTGRRGGKKRAPWFVAALANGVFACFISYCFISMIAGQAGLLAYRDLGIRMNEMKTRLDALETRNLELRTTSGALQNNADRIAREAQELGYAAHNERFILLSGIASSVKPSDAQIHSVDMLPVGDSSGLPDSVVKELSVVIGLAVVLTSIFTRQRPKPRAKG